MIRELIALEPDSRLWIYTADRYFSEEETELIREDLYEFLEKWTSHSQQLLTYGNVFHHRFLTIFVDENTAGNASGCSLDTCTHFLENLGKKWNTHFFDRSKVHFLIDNEVIEYDYSSLSQLIKDEIITKDTLVFDHTVNTKISFIKKWIHPIGDTWMKRFFK